MGVLMHTCSLLELCLSIVMKNRNVVSVNGYITEIVFVLSGTKDHFYFLKIKHLNE